VCGADVVVDHPTAQSSREEQTAKVFVGIDLAEARRMNFNYVGKIIGPKVRGPLRGVCVSE
jgi:hypothetical protein